MHKNIGVFMAAQVPVVRAVLLREKLAAEELVKIRTHAQQKALALFVSAAIAVGQLIATWLGLVLREWAGMGSRKPWPYTFSPETGVLDVNVITTTAANSTGG